MMSHFMRNQPASNLTKGTLHFVSRPDEVICITWAPMGVFFWALG